MEGRRTHWKTAVCVVASMVICGPAFAVTVEISIKPDAGSTNAINPTSRGVVPVAILGSTAFDVAEVDETTLVLEPGSTSTSGGSGAAAIRSAFEDVNNDEIVDLVSHYRTQEIGLAFGDTQGCVSGQLRNGTPVEGCDAISTVGACGIGFEVAFLLLPWMLLRSRRERRALD